MTISEFELIARLLRSYEPMRTAVRLVIFDKLDNAAAAKAAGTTPQATHRSTKRFLALHKEIIKVFSKA